MFDAVKGLLFKEESLTPATPKEPAVAKSTGIGGFAAQPGVASPGGHVTPTLNAEMVEALKKVVTNRKTAFTTLEEKSNAMAAAIPDETMRTRAAFGILSAEGRNATDIIKAIEIHVVDIDGEQGRFSQAIAQAKTEKSGALRNEIANIEKALTNDNDLIQRLQQQIADAQGRVINNQQQITEKSSAVAMVEAECDAKAQQFNAAAEAVKNSLTQRKNVLSSVLS